MERRKAAAIAGATSVTLVAAVIALGANFGLFGLGRDGSDIGTYPVSERNVVPAPGAGVAGTAVTVAPDRSGTEPGGDDREERAGLEVSEHHENDKDHDDSRDHKDDKDHDDSKDHKDHKSDKDHDDD